MNKVLRNARLERGLSLQKLADLAGVHKNTIYMLERDEVTPTIQIAYAVADQLGSRLEVLFPRRER